MNQLQIFNNDEFGQVRVVEIKGSPWFVAADVCKILEIDRTQTRRLDDDEKGLYSIHTPGGEQQMTVINESGLYALTLTSRKPYAKKFRKWLTSEVAVSIRKHGMYLNPNAPIDPNFLRKLADEIESRDRQIAVLSTQIAELQPKAGYYDLILQCPDLVSTSIIAKDYGYSARSFNRLLHRLGVQFKQGETWLLYQKYASQGWTSTKTHNFPDKNGRQHCRVHTYWTQKGRIELYNLLKQNGYLPSIERAA